MQMRYSSPLFAVALVLAACGQRQNASVASDGRGSVTISADGQRFSLQGGDRSHTGVAIAANGQHVSLQARDGQSVLDVNTSGGVKVSGKLPAFVSLYPGAKVVSLASGNNQSGALVLESNAPPSDVIGFYRQKAEAAGFTQNSNAAGAGNVVYSAALAGRAVHVIASPSGGGTRAQVIWSSQ